MAETVRSGNARRLGRAAAWFATIVSVLIGLGLLGMVMAVSDCSFAGGTCPDPDPTFDDDSFRFGLLAGAFMVTPPLLLARRRWFTVAGITLAVSLTLGYAAATG
jgi:hypothetical protein